MLTILDQSVSLRKVRHFRIHRWKSANNLANTLSETFWIIKTSTRKHTFIEYLRLKVLLGFANEVETRCCYDSPGTLENILFLDALRAFRTEVSEDTFWERLNYLQRLFNLPEWSPNLYYTLDGVISYEITESRRSIRKVKKYSGYVRNSSSVGSKRRSTSPRPEPERFEWNSNVERDYFSFLTVGEFFSGLPGSIFFTLKRTKSPKRKPSKTKLSK